MVGAARTNPSIHPHRTTETGRGLTHTHVLSVYFFRVYFFSILFFTTTKA